MSLKFQTAFLMLIAFTISVFAAEALMRFPDIHENTVVFVSGGDIWKAPVTGGEAVRLTLHDGEERYPKFSPDGSLIAFTGEYDGNSDVYVMDTFGGNITRLTWHPGADEVIGWHAQKNKILFRSARAHFGFNHLYLIGPDGSGLERLILHNAAQGSFSPDGNKIAFNKISREVRTWKRYQGGLAQEVYIYNFQTDEIKSIANFKGTDRTPMWIGDKIYFSSDRERILNIFSYDTKTKTVEQVTNHGNYDVRRPSMGKDKIVYELGGDLYVLDTAAQSTSKIPVQVRSDFPELRPYLKTVSDNVTDYDVSPSGKQALITARGEIFSVPEKYGRARNLTESSGARDKDAVWSPDGKRFAYISDAAGEYNIYLADPAGEWEAQQLTDFDKGYRHSLRWSPDGKMLSFTDQTLTLYILNVATKAITNVDKAEFENIDVALNLKPVYDHAWSPDSRYIAYSKMDAGWVNKIYIYSVEEKESRCISHGMFNDFHPVFSKDGKRLFFISNRRFDPTFGDLEWEMVYKDMAGIYVFTLDADTPPLFPLRDDTEPADETATDEDVKVTIDFDGLNDRVELLPPERGNYRFLAVNDKDLFYLNKDDGDFNRFEFRNVGAMDLFAFNFEDREERTVIKGIDNYKLNGAGTHIIYKKNKDVGIIESSAKESSGSSLDLSDLKMHFDPLAEWRQIFNEAWRMERDYYYEPNMHGLDWPAMKDKYGKMLDRATCRQDVRFVVGELIGELNTSHTYVFGGDKKREAEQINVGLLGADYEADLSAKRYRFAKIYKSNDWNRDVTAPLVGPGKDINAGDYLLEVNGKDVITERNIYSYFVDLAGEQVTLLVNDKPSKSGAREIKVKPASNEWLLRYLDWVEQNRRTVEKASNGEIGYIHFPDTYTGSARMFAAQYYAQTHKKGLVIDGRFNGGGLDPDIFLNRLAKRPLAYWTRRYSHDQATPWMVSDAHMVCITNRQAGSGGDELPFLFREKGMGPVIGTRTWGGLVGVSMWIPLIDGGGLSAPDYRIYDTEGNWVVENEGVTPDIIVDLHPKEVAEGHDAQLMKAIELLKEKIKNEPREWPGHEPFPLDR